MSTSSPLRFRRGHVIVAALVSGSCWALPAFGQDDVRRNTVNERPRPEYDHAGIQVGPFEVSPEISLSATGDDNIFADDTNTKSDIYLSVRPEVNIAYGLPITYVNINAFYDRSIHAQYGSEDTSTYGTRVSGSVEIDRLTKLGVTVDYAHLAEKRGSLGTFANSTQPVQYDNTSVEAKLDKELGSLRLAVTGRARKVGYADTPDTGGGLDQSFRDFRVYSGSVQAGYSKTGLSQIFVRGSYDKREYLLGSGDPGFDPVNQFDRGSTSYRVEIGYARQISQLIYATFSVGYLNIDYVDTRLRDNDGLSFAAEAIWNVTTLSTINLRAERKIDETSSPLTAGNIRTEGEISVDHELLRNLILNANFRYSDINPSGLIDKSQELEAGFSGRYFVTPRLSLNAGILHEQRTSNNDSIAYKSNSIYLGAKFAF